MPSAPASHGLSRFGALGACLVLAAAATSAACGSDPCTGTECGGAAASSSTGGSSNGTARSGPCASDATCDSAHGFGCVAGECRYPCSTHFDCHGQGVCDTLKGDDGSTLGAYCALLEQPVPAGQYYTRCPNYTECDGTAGFTCLGAGVGDSDAYCSSSCGTDDDCPQGFFCDSVADSSGNRARYCVRRRFCAPCSADADCLSVAGQICAPDQSGERICTKLCDPEVDSCPWGNAAVCRVWDPNFGQPTCGHRYGSCHGEGKGCEPCVRNEDCPTGVCYGSSFTGEHWCIDTSVDCNCDDLPTSNDVCSNGNNCPRTPGGLVMSCYAPSNGAGNAIANSCFGANTSGSSALSSPQAGCWGPL